MGCHLLLTAHTLCTYFLPILKLTRSFLLKLSDAELKKESKASTDSKNDHISTIVTTMKKLVCQLNRERGSLLKEPSESTSDSELVTFSDVVELHLEMILRLLKVSSFNGKMNALIEINRILHSSSISTALPSSDLDFSSDSVPSAKLAVSYRIDSC